MKDSKNREISGKLIIRHAGSLNSSFGAVNSEFQRLHPGIAIEDIPGGSAGVLRLVMDGGACDVLASADYQLFAQWLLPDFADWYLVFASNEFMLRCAEGCRYKDEINAGNWHEILLGEGLNFWRPDPDDDPGGYRTLMVLQLAEKYYDVPGFYDDMMTPENSMILNRNNYLEYIDNTYTFAYRSSPVPPGQWNIKLPDEINLGSRESAEYYKNAEVIINGKKPGDKLTLHGEPMLFGITIPKKSTNKAAAIEWLKFLLGDSGRKIAEKAGLTLLKPVIASDNSLVPCEIQKYLQKDSPGLKR